MDADEEEMAKQMQMMGKRMQQQGMEMEKMGKEMRQKGMRMHDHGMQMQKKGAPKEMDMQKMEKTMDAMGKGMSETDQDTDTWRLGAEFGATDALSLRAGFIYNTAAEREFSVSPLLPEAERNYYSAGLGYRFGRGFGVDVAYQLVDQADRRGRVRGRAPDATEAELEARNVGVYSSDVHLVNVTLSYRFGGR